MRRADREITAASEIDEILSRADACRVALVDGQEPYIVTLNYGFRREGARVILYFHCANEGRKLDIIRTNPRACFCVDVDHILVEGGNGCGWGMKYSSVVGFGQLDIVTGERKREEGLQALMEHYSGRTGFSFDPQVLSATTVLRFTAERVTGKKRI